MEHPRDAIIAVTHPDPYPYYADLVKHKPLYRDEGLGLWVASGAAAVTAVLTSDLCRVRPLAEPVPRALLGTPAADIFRRLVRMTDGPSHAPVKQAVSATLAIDLTRPAEEASRQAQRLAEELSRRPTTIASRALPFAVYAIGGLLGVEQNLLPQIAHCIGDFVRCLAPCGTPEQVARGVGAAGHLRELFHALLDARARDGSPALLAELARQAKRAGCDDADVIVANGIGYLSQAYQATAGLIGNTLVALARHGEVRDQLKREPGLLRAVLREVLRYDPPVQNTRRFVARDGVVAGQPMKEGDAVLVVLAAANRDLSANPHPDRFDVSRTEPRVFTFGLGAHACPGEALASTIAQAGVERLTASGVEPERLTETPSYRPSANTRIPVVAALDRAR